MCFNWMRGVGLLGGLSEVEMKKGDLRNEDFEYDFVV